MTNDSRKNKPSPKTTPRPARKTARKKPLSFDVPSDALASRSAGWVYRSDATRAELPAAATPAALPAAATHAALPPATAVRALLPSSPAAAARGFFASAVDVIGKPMEMILLIVLAACPGRSR